MTGAGNQSARELARLPGVRHESTRQIVQWFEFDHLPEGLPRQTSAHFAALVDMLLEELPDSPELTVALRKLLEAKDAAVRAAIAASGFTCPACGAVSHHPTDKAEGYCGRCHEHTAPPIADHPSRERFRP